MHHGGGAQWMTAGSGIVHSEMPEQENGLLRGFQLWVNLPAADKMTAPRYQDIAPERIPEVKSVGANVRVVAGSYGGVTGPVNGIATEPLYLDVKLDAARVSKRRSLVRTMRSSTSTTARAHRRRGPRPRRPRSLNGRRPDLRRSDGAGRVSRRRGQAARRACRSLRADVMNTRAELERAFEDPREGRFLGMASSRGSAPAGATSPGLGLDTGGQNVAVRLNREHGDRRVILPLRDDAAVPPESAVEAAAG